MGRIVHRLHTTKTKSFATHSYTLASDYVLCYTYIPNLAVWGSCFTVLSSAGGTKGTCAEDGCARACCCSLEAAQCMGVIIRAHHHMSVCRGDQYYRAPREFLLYVIHA